MQQISLFEIVQNQKAKPVSKPDPKLLKLADKFDATADKMQDKIDYARRVRTHNPTRKRLQEEEYQRAEANRQEQVQFALYALAKAYRHANVPNILSGLKSKKAVEILANQTAWSKWNADVLEKAGITEKNYQEARELLLEMAAPPDRAKENRKAELERKAKRMIGSIPGFFPTPDAVIERMVQEIGVRNVGEPEMTLCDPQAGSGNILDWVAKHKPHIKLYAAERQHSLIELLEAKGHEILAHDCFDLRQSFDRILMNPPFENGQDIEMVRFAYENNLNDGGALASVLSNSVMFRNGKYEEFRNWADEVGGWFEELPAGSFKESGTGVTTVLFFAEK